MDKFWTIPCRLSFLAVLVPRLVQDQPLAQRKTWLVGLGAAMSFLFLIFILMDYTVSNKDKEEETVRKEDKEGEGNWGLELEEKVKPPNRARTASSSS